MRALTTTTMWKKTTAFHVALERRISLPNLPI
jgi:hypothetical protein